MRSSLLRSGVVVLLIVASPMGAADYLTSRPSSKPAEIRQLQVGDRIETGAVAVRRLLPDGVVAFIKENTRGKVEGTRSLSLDAGEIYLEAPRQKNAEPITIKTAHRQLLGTGSFAVNVGDTGTGVVVAAGKVSIDGKKEPLRAGQQLTPGEDRIQPAPRLSYLLKWTREPMCADESPLVPGSNFAGGALVAIDPQGQEMKLTLRKYHIDVHVEDGFARTTIDQTYFNHENQQLEGTFYFPLPADASLSRLAMYVDGTLMEGGMAERDYARQVYESIRFMRRDPALLEWLDGSTFKMRVFPIEPRQEKRIILSYTQKLPGLYGMMDYRFPAGHSLPAVRDWSFQARIKNSAAAAWQCPSHNLTEARQDGDLILKGSLKNAKFDKDVRLQIADLRLQIEREARFSSIVQDGKRYLMLRYRPDIAQSKIENQESKIQHWLVLFETSADRDPLLARAQIEVVRNMLANTDPADTFSVMTANTRVRSMSSQPLAVSRTNIDQALAFLEKSHLIGALDLGQALDKVAEFSKSDGVLLHVGSGIPAMGEKRHDVLARKVPKGMQYVGIGVGPRWNRDLMKLAAECTGGHFAQVNPDEPISWRTFDLAATLRSPRLLDVQVADAAGEARFLAFNQIVAQGEEVCAVARLDEKDTVSSVAFRGTLAGKPFERVLPVKDIADNAGHLPRTWAKLEIDRLLAENAVKHKDAVVALSRSMYVTTPFTSLLVLENEDMYTQYKVDRGRKDHWAMYPCPNKIAVVYEPEDGGPDWKTVKAGERLPARKVLTTIVAGGAAVSTDGRNSAGHDFPVEAFLRRPKRAPLGVTPAGVFEPDLPGSITSPLRARWDGQQSAWWLQNQPAFFPHPIASPLPELRSLEAQTRVRKTDHLLLFLGDGALAGGAIGSKSSRTMPAAVDLPIPIASSFGMSVPLDFTPSGRVGQVIIVGNELSQDRVIRRSLGLYPGQSLTNVAKAGEKLRPETLRHFEAQLEALTAARKSSDDAKLGFHDLVRYAPGMKTSLADIQAVLEAEALPDAASRPGKIDAEARELFAKARKAGWRSVTLPGEKDEPALVIHFDRQGRFAYERELPPGIKEKVVCDGKTLLHLYPQLGLGAKRTVSRFHRLDLAGTLPWIVPPAEDLARGADLVMAGENTVALIPGRAGSVSDRSTDRDLDPKSKVVSSHRTPNIHFLFDDEGNLVEKRLVLMPKNEIVSRLILSPDGTVILKDGKDKIIDQQNARLSPAQAPKLSLDTKDVVVLSLPFRTPEHVKKSLKIESKDVANLTLQEALPLFAAYYAAGNTNEAYTVFKVFHAKNQRQLGFYVLLAACGQNLDAQNGDVLAEHLDEPLAQYLALYSSPVLRKHASQWAVSSGQWKEPFLSHLGLTHALFQRWQNEKIMKGEPGRVKIEKSRALDYVKKNKGTGFAWALLSLMQERAGEDRAFHRELVECWPLFADVPGLKYVARYETARSLWKAGQKKEAREAFVKLYNDTLAKDELPAIDADFRSALLGNGSDADAWGDLVRKTGRDLIAKKYRPAVLALARQCGQLEDLPLANQLLEMTFDGVKDAKELLALQKAGIQFLQETGQLAEADVLLKAVLADPEQAKRPELWRMGVTLAQKRGMNVRKLECLQKALDLEFAHLPETIDLEAIRTDYGKLLEHYQNLAEAMVALKLQPPAGFLARVIRTADRWRAVDTDADRASTLAAGILRRLGDRDLEWDYLTTPIAKQPNESAPWASLAATLNRQGELELSDRAYKAAFESEPTNAQLLWDRAENLRQAGKSQQAHTLYRQIAEGSWQDRFAGIQSQARARVD